MSRNCIRLVPISMLFWCPLAGTQQPSPANGSLVGDVTDAVEGAPIARAFVFVRGWAGVGEKVVDLDAKGGFKLSLPPGLYDVFVAAQSFAPTCRKVAIASGGSVEFKARLSADSEHMEDN